jgi:RNA polymerase sigma-54 factor
MKQSLQLRLHQQLTLTPQLQQSIRLLQLSTLELSQEISQMLQDNPLLERLDGEERFESPTAEAPAEEARPDRDDVYEEMAWGDRAVTPSHGSGGDDDEDHDYQQADASHTNLHQHLCNQLSLTPMSVRDRQLVGLLIEALDEDGYLSASLEELTELFPADMEVDEAELGTALKLLQSFDPAGIGARDLGECLWLQLNTLPDDTPHLTTAKRMVREHLGLLAEREYGKLKKLFDLKIGRAHV